MGGEGVGSIIIKRGEAAKEDRDYIYARVAGGGIAYGGRTLGLTSPNMKSHKQAFLNALADAKIENVNQIVAIETHGTGMPLGDESELRAFGEVFEERGREDHSPCIIGAAKSVFGHLEAASGAMAMIKSIATLQENRMHGIKGLNQVNTNYNLKYFSISSEDQSLSFDKNADNVLGMHSYGIGGVSAFLLLKQAGGVEGLVVEGDVKSIFVLSAQSDYTLKAYADLISNYLREYSKTDGFNFRHFLASFQTHREEMKVRLAIEVVNVDDLMDKMRRYLNVESVPGLWSNSSQQVIPSDSKYSSGNIAQKWVNAEPVDWEIRFLSRFPYPTYPMDKRKPFWINQELDDKASEIIAEGNDSIETTNKTNKFSMLDY
jgi:acyl transferase domain-containing protein